LTASSRSAARPITPASLKLEYSGAFIAGSKKRFHW
jgi:hypothetical protein